MRSYEDDGDGRIRRTRQNKPEYGDPAQHPGYLEHKRKSETTDRAAAALTIAEWEPPAKGRPTTPDLR